MVGNVCAEVNPIRWWISMPCKSDVRQLSSVFMFFPPAGWGPLDFTVSELLCSFFPPSSCLPPFLPPSFSFLPPSFFLPPPFFLNCKLQISVATASTRSQWALLDFNRAPDLSGHCRTSTASFRFQWALPDLNCKLQILVASAGPQWAVPGFNYELQMWHCRTWNARNMQE